MVQNDPALLNRLSASGVEFVVVGGVCGVLHGVPLMTFDLDVCVRLGEINLRRIDSAIRDLNPYHRLTPNRIGFELTASLCESWKNLYLGTDLGNLDCLGLISGIGDFNYAMKLSTTIKMSYGEIRALSLDGLIVAKEAAGRDKDLYAVRLIRAVKEKKDQQKDLL